MLCHSIPYHFHTDSIIISACHLKHRPLFFRWAGYNQSARAGERQARELCQEDADCIQGQVYGRPAGNEAREEEPGGETGFSDVEGRAQSGDQQEGGKAVNICYVRGTNVRATGLAVKPVKLSLI